MMVNAKVGAIFLAHTRVGSRDTYQELENFGFRLLGTRHWNLDDLRRYRTAHPERSLFGFEWWEEIGGWDRDWKFFCTIRDPYDFLLSHYCWIPLHGKLPMEEPIPLSWIKSLGIDVQEKYFPFTPGRLWRFLYNPGCWRVLRWETLQEDLLAALKALNLSGELRHLPKGTNPDTRTLNKPPGDPKEWWSPEALEWFQETYAQELHDTNY